ncbi:MAG TPA: helix-turn-helix transcriptional regulator [Pseudonocardiaceae bacterium]|nr:helix-turn-helix transcriptional regulator [Pseudonocardiaceae bacterium]
MAVDSERPRLREFRVQLGWTQHELANRVAHLAWMEHRDHVAVNADMVAKWERGVKGVSPRYRELLCRLFGVTADQLGLKNSPARVAAREVSTGGDESLVGMVDRAAQLLDQLGAAGSVLAPHLLHAWQDAATTRRTMLGLLDPAAMDPAGRARAVTASIADLEQLAERYHALYETADPPALMTPVAAHLRMTAVALDRDPAACEHHRLLGNQARVAILAGRLAADDLDNPMAGRAYFTLACDSAREAGDADLLALAHGYAAGFAAAEGMTATALEHVTKASEPMSPILVSWLATVEATIHADRSEPAAAREALDRAHAAVPSGCTSPGSSPEGTATNLAAATGHVLLRAGDYRGAREALIAALDQLDPAARRSRVLVLVDLATAELHSGDLAAACSWATQAATVLQQAVYALGAARLRAFRAAAQRPLTSRALRSLDDHLRRIAA